MWPGCASKNAYHINIQSHWDAYIYLYWQSQLFISNQKIFNLLYNAVLLYGGTSLCHMVFTKHIEVGKISCLQWHVSSFELNMQLRDILHHFKPTAEAAASTSVFVHLILGQNTYKCFTTLGALPKHFFGFDVLSRSGQPQLSNLTPADTTTKLTNKPKAPWDPVQANYDEVFDNGHPPHCHRRPLLVSCCKVSKVNQHWRREPTHRRQPLHHSQVIG